MIKKNRGMRRTAGAMAMTMAIAAIGVFGPVSMTAYADQRGTVTADVLNVRSGPSTGNPCIGTLRANESISIISSENGWYQISYNGLTAYVSGQYVRTESGGVVSSGTGKTNVSSLNVREGAGTNYRSLGVISKGTAVTIVGSEGDWYKVTVNVNGNSATAYVKAEYITLDSSSGSGSSESTPEAPVTENSGTGTVNVSALNVRSQNNTNCSVLGTIFNGTAVTITGTAGDWYQVTTTINGKSVSGYVYAQYITKTENKPSQETPAEEPSNEPSETSGQEGTVNDGPLNVRTSASMNGSVIGTLARGSKVQVLGTEGNWYRIKATVNGSEVTAYASASYISVGSNSDSGNNSSETTEESTYTEVSETVWATEGVNIRSGAGTNFNVLTILRKNASIQRVAVGSNGWSKVKYGNAEGYIKSEFLTTTNPNPTTATGNAVVDYAMQFLGNPYVYAGNDLNTGVDCSGFTQQVYLHFGVTLNRIADDQRYNGISVPVEEAQPGDLFFYGSNGYATHVALYIGDGKVIHASTPETGIIISNFDYRTPMQVNRIMIK